MANNEKLGKKLWFNILLFNLMGAIAWNVENMYFNTFLYNSIYNGASAEALAGTMAPTTAISRMVALSAATAVITTFIMGTFSDRMKNRKIFVSFGYIAWGIVTALFGFISRDNVAALFGLTDSVKILTATVWVVIIMDMVMTFMGSTSNDSAFNAWVTDVTTTKTRQQVETAFTFVGLVAMGIVMGIGSFAQAGTISYTVFFVGLGLVVVVCGIVGLFTIKEPEHRTEEETNKSYWADLFYGFNPKVVKKNSKLYLVLTSVCLYNCAIQVFFPYLFVYLQYVVLPQNANVNLLSAKVIVTAVISIAVLLFGVIYLLKIADKHRTFTFVAGVVCLTVGLFIMSTSTNIMAILIGVSPTVIGYVVLMIQLNAAIRDFIPVGMAGRFQGIRMIFVVLIPMIVGPAIGDIACLNAGAVYTNEYGVETIVPDAKMFIYSAVISVLVLIPLSILIKKGFYNDKKEA